MCVTNIVGCEGNTAASCAGQDTIPGEIFQCTHMQPSSLLQMVNTVVLTAVQQQRMAGIGSLVRTTLCYISTFYSYCINNL